MNKLTILSILFFLVNLIYAQPNPKQIQNVSIKDHVKTTVKIYETDSKKYAITPILDIERNSKGELVIDKTAYNDVYYAEFKLDVNPERVKREVSYRLQRINDINTSNLLNPECNSLEVQCDVSPLRKEVVLFAFDEPGKFSGSQIPCRIQFEREQECDFFIEKLKQGKIVLHVKYKSDATITVASIASSIENTTFKEVVRNSDIVGDEPTKPTSPWYNILGKSAVTINQKQKKHLEAGYKNVINQKIIIYGKLINEDIANELISSSMSKFNNIFEEDVVNNKSLESFANDIHEHLKYQYPSKSFTPSRISNFFTELKEIQEDKQQEKVKIKGEAEVDYIKIFTGKAKFEYEKEELRESMKEMGYKFESKDANIIIPKSVTFYNIDKKELTKLISIDRKILHKIDGEITDNLTFVSVPPSQEISDNLDANLVCHFPFDNGNARNVVADGRVQDGSFIGKNGNIPVATTGINKEQNGALYFNGSSGIQVPNSDDINFLPKQSYSLSLWIRFNPDDNDNYIYKGNTASSVILDKWDSPKNFKDSKHYLSGSMYRSSHGYPYMIRIVKDSVTFARYTGRYIEFHKDIKRGIKAEIKNNMNNKYHHVVATVENGKQTLYVDGVKEKNTVQDSYTNLTANNYPLFIGCRGEGIHYGYKGSLDELRIYNKTLSAEEVKYLFDNKK